MSNDAKVSKSKFNSGITPEAGIKSIQTAVPIASVEVKREELIRFYRQNCFMP